MLPSLVPSAAPGNLTMLYFSQAAQDEVTEAAAVALCKVFTYYIEYYYDCIIPAPPVQCKYVIVCEPNCH